jgi:hypothetical protein
MLKRILLLLGLGSAGWAWWTSPKQGSWSTGSVQSGQIEHITDLQELPSAYWSFLRRATLGLVRPKFDQERVDLKLFGIWSLIHLGAPTLNDDQVSISWPIQHGLLVARSGGQFTLAQAGNRARLEVSGFRPRLPRWLYYMLQQPLHCWLGNKFLAEI